MDIKIKKINQILILLIIIILIPASIFAINNVFEGWRTTTVNQTVNAHGICRNVKQTGVNSYFVPTQSSTEWTSFLSSKPSDVDANSCPTSGTWQAYDCVGAVDICYNGASACFDAGSFACQNQIPPMVVGATCSPYGQRCSLLGGDPKTSTCSIQQYICR